MAETKTTAKPAAKPPPTPQSKQPFDRGAFYPLCRMLHAYFSAFAFLALIFFSITGVMLNHPDWFETLTAKESAAEVTVGADEIAKAKSQSDPGPALAAAVGKLTPCAAPIPAPTSKATTPCCAWMAPRAPAPSI